MQARITNSLKHLATAVEVFAPCMYTTGHDRRSFPAATGHVVNFSQIRMVRNTNPDNPQSTPRFRKHDRVGTLNVDNAERAFLIRSGDKDWGVLYGAAHRYLSR